MGNQKYFNTKECAKYLSRTAKAVRELARRRQIPYYKPAGRLLFDIEQINEWIKSHEIVSLEELGQQK